MATLKEKVSQYAGNVLAGVYHGNAALDDDIANAAMLVRKFGEKTGGRQENLDALKYAEDKLRERAEKHRALAAPLAGSSAPEQALQILGSAPSAIAKYSAASLLAGAALPEAAAGIVGFAAADALSAADKGPLAAGIAAVKGGAMGAIFKATEGITGPAIKDLPFLKRAIAKTKRGLLIGAGAVGLELPEVITEDETTPENLQSMAVGATMLGVMAGAGGRAREVDPKFTKINDAAVHQEAASILEENTPLPPPKSPTADAPIVKDSLGLPYKEGKSYIPPEHTPLSKDEFDQLKVVKVLDGQGSVHHLDPDHLEDMVDDVIIGGLRRPDHPLQIPGQPILGTFPHEAPLKTGGRLDEGGAYIITDAKGKRDGPVFNMGDEIHPDNIKAIVRPRAKESLWDAYSRTMQEARGVTPEAGKPVLTKPAEAEESFLNAMQDPSRPITSEDLQKNRDLLKEQRQEIFSSLGIKNDLAELEPIDSSETNRIIKEVGRYGLMYPEPVAESQMKNALETAELRETLDKIAANPARFNLEDPIEIGSKSFSIKDFAQLIPRIAKPYLLAGRETIKHEVIPGEEISLRLGPNLGFTGDPGKMANLILRRGNVELPRDEPLLGIHGTEFTAPRKMIPLAMSTDKGEYSQAFVAGHESGHAIAAQKDWNSDIRAMKEHLGLSQDDIDAIMKEARFVSQYIARPRAWANAKTQFNMFIPRIRRNIAEGDTQLVTARNSLSLQMLRYLHSNQELLADATATLLQRPDLAKEFMPKFYSALKKFVKVPGLREKISIPMLLAGVTALLHDKKEKQDATE